MVGKEAARLGLVLAGRSGAAYRSAADYGSAWAETASHTNGSTATVRHGGGKYCKENRKMQRVLVIYLFSFP